MTQIQFVTIKKAQIVSNLCFRKSVVASSDMFFINHFFGGLQFCSPKRNLFIFVFLNFRLYSPCVKLTQNCIITIISRTRATNGIRLASISIIMMMFGISVSSFLIAIKANMKKIITGIIYTNSVSILF